MLSCIDAACEHQPCGMLSGEFSLVSEDDYEVDIYAVFSFGPYSEVLPGTVASFGPPERSYSLYRHWATAV